MPKVTAATLAVTALILLGLTGCADTAENAADERRGSETADSPSPEASPDELVAKAPSVDDAEQRFLDYVRAELLPTSGIADASDAQLIDAGHEGCEQVKSGVPLEEIRLVEGEEPTAAGYYMDTSAIFSGAQMVFCPETIQNLDG